MLDHMGTRISVFRQTLRSELGLAGFELAARPLGPDPLLDSDCGDCGAGVF